MVSLYDNYNYQLQNFENDENDIITFLDILNRFMNYSYEEKVNLASELWGDVKDSKTIFYGNKCKVVITKDKERKFHYNFDTSNLDMWYLEKYIPGFAEQIHKQVLLEKEKISKASSENDQTKYEDQLLNYNNSYNNINISNTRKD